jgi:hypothetical protein
MCRRRAIPRSPGCAERAGLL